MIAALARHARACARSSRPARSAAGARSIGDLDLLAETDDGRGADRAAFTGLGVVDHVVNQGGYKAAVRLLRGPQVDLMVMPPGEAGTYRIHFTGSKEHNVRLAGDGPRPGLEPVREGVPADRRGRRAADRRRAPSCGRSPTETEAYAFLGLPFIEPELREDEGEIEAALAGTPAARSSTLGDLRGDLHSHSDWSDGTHPIEVMAEAARRRGHAYQVLTDHTQSLAIARGLTPGPGRGAARDHRRAQRPLRRGGGRRHGAARDAAGGLPAAPRLRARDPRRRRARLRGRPARVGSTSSSRRSTSSRRQPRPS